MRARLWRCLGLGLLVCGLSSQALAAGRSRPDPDPSDYTYSGFGHDISVYGLVNFTYHGVGGGAGAQFAWALFPNGFLRSPRFRDAFHIEGGLDFGYWTWKDVELFGFAPSAGVRWAVYVLDNLAPFVCAKLGPAVELWDELGVRERKAGLYWLTTAGVLWDLNDAISMRAEWGWSGYHDMLRIGVLFRL
ncbi:MAG: hypothetical protein JXR96_06560 [Deltaproteobacteria bacterium]|nr:hypothetical protein [Deltaproteobacteria bacterium]